LPELNSKSCKKPRPHEGCIATHDDDDDDDDDDAIVT
jgi:hypothetical protein